MFCLIYGTLQESKSSDQILRKNLYLLYNLKHREEGRRRELKFHREEQSKGTIP